MNAVVDSRRVRYLFFLVLTVSCAEIVEIYALSGLAGSRITFSFEQWQAYIVYGLAPSKGPFVIFALAGLIVFRDSYWALWCLTFLATAYALLIVLGLLVEFGMATQAIASAERGMRYMNCAGHPRLFVLLFCIPVTVGTILIAAFVVAIESTLRSLFAVPTEAVR